MMLEGKRVEAGEWRKGTRMMMVLIIFLVLWVLVVHVFSLWKYFSICMLYFNKNRPEGVPGRLSRLRVWFWLRSWSRSLWVWALRRALCCQHKACFGSSVPLSASPLLAHALSLFQKWISIKKNFKYIYSAKRAKWQGKIDKSTIMEGNLNTLSSEIIRESRTKNWRYKQ